MKFTTAILIAAMLFAFCGTTLVAQKREAAEQTFTEEIQHPFPTVWKGIQKTLKDMDISVETQKKTQNDEGLYKGNIRTEYYVFSQGEDSTLDVLDRYGITPTIRGGAWTAGRIQYKIILLEQSGDATKMILTAVLSGYESFVTQIAHFWASNGVLEKQFIEKIKTNIELVAKEEE